jgi:hypothetical protein
VKLAVLANPIRIEGEMSIVDRRESGGRFAVRFTFMKDDGREDARESSSSASSGRART